MVLRAISILLLAGMLAQPAFSAAPVMTNKDDAPPKPLRGYTVPPVSPEYTKRLTEAVSQAVGNELKKLAGMRSKSTVPSRLKIIGGLMDCTQAKIGKKSAQSFYGDMYGASQQVSALCKQGKKADAKKLVVAKLTQKQKDPAMLALIGCYDAQAGVIQQQGGHALAVEAANYARWARAPQAAAVEIQEDMICRPAPAAKPAPAASSN
jgi:hypothetical protein